MNKRNNSKQKINSLRGLKNFLKSTKRLQKKKYLKRAQHNFLFKARKHSYFKGELFHFGSKRLNKEENKRKPDLPHVSKFLFKKQQSFTTNRVSWLSKGIINLPPLFSLIRSPRDSYQVLKNLLHLLYKGNYTNIIIDYEKCQEIDLDASVCMDIILLEYTLYMKQCIKNKFRPTVRQIKPINFSKPPILQILSAIGAFRNVIGIKIEYPDIISYPLSIINKHVDHDSGLDTTKMVDYIQECLARMNKKLTVDARKNLCDVIGEILINAEEHSTTDYCFSIGFFQDHYAETGHSGIFNLVIFNFGDTIYEKFKSPNCQQHIVDRMRSLSELYVKKNFFGNADFQEETLWTLYALQEGITSVPKEKYRKRGNGSITFIESFFELKSSGTQMDDISRMTILSGNCKIVFDGRHEIVNVTKGNTTFKIMAFNKEGNIEMRPDKKNVTFVENYFPGTLISAKILINDNDIQNSV